MPDLYTNIPVLHRSGTSKAEIHRDVRGKRESQALPAIAVPLEEKTADEDIPQSALVDDVGKIWTRHAEATWVELFYDLFFVANLTTFTDTHQINDNDSLQSYIGYFAIIWFTWLQAALFDLRFGKDSLIQRVAKALQIGVMVGFSAVNDHFDPRYPGKNWESFKNLSLLLFASRFAIAIQYFVVWWTVRQYPKTKMPLLLMSILMAVSMLFFLGLAFSFRPDGNVKGYIGWYVILALETMSVLAISLKWKVVGFKGTHLIQRMGLLTLIVMGEGIIGLCRATSLVHEGIGGWSVTMTGQAISGVLCIYFIYMLYFDDEPNYVYSTVPQQIWAVLHFPFHLGIVLFVEGQQQLMIWQGIIVSLNRLSSRLQDAFVGAGQNNGAQVATRVLVVINDFFPEGEAEAVTNNPAFTFNLAPLRDSGDPGFIAQQLDKLWDLCAYAIFNGYNIEAPSGNADLFNSDQRFEGFSSIYELVLVYFFVAAGGFLLILALFTYLMKWPKDRYEFLHIAYRVVFGIIIGLIALVATNGDRVANLLTGPWAVPMMMLLLLLLLIVDKLTIFMALKYSDRKLNQYKWLHGQGTQDPAGSREGLTSTSTSSSSSSSLSSPPSSISSSNGLPAMPGADNSAPDSSSSELSNPYGDYNPYASPSSAHDDPGPLHTTPSAFTRDHQGNILRPNSRDYYVAPSQLQQVDETADEDFHSPLLPSDHDIATDIGDGVQGRGTSPPESTPHPLNSSIPSDNPSQNILGHPPSPPPASYPLPPHLSTLAHLNGDYNNHRPYEDFLGPPTPPLGATYYEAAADGDGRRSTDSPVTVIRRSFESLESVVPRPLNVKLGLGRRRQRGSQSSEQSYGARASTDMPQTRRGFMASPVGFAEGVEGRVGDGGGGRSAGWQLGRQMREQKGMVGGVGRFMRSTESMLGMKSGSVV
ncbi:hypothetical protein DRE_03860 [Drechslerella stenobrocha 248]|uniref:Uncharacterized protein n=1 Tax=Drechslerella stenobrocha 248 TaxID=1043628 RepID=W7I3Q3_9PEZI|nr:hypothetical protein DRE_03860 [Drechslerella stenobrocha 248]